MSDTISRADAVKTVIRKCSPICAWQVGTQQYPDCVVAEINALPSADAVEVVRCKDCKYGEERIEDYRCWMLDEDWDIRFSPMHFCSYGERREESEVEA